MSAMDHIVDMKTKGGFYWLGHARTQAGAQRRVAKKRYLRRQGYDVAGEITNVELNKMIKGQKGFDLNKEMRDIFG